MYQGKDIPGGWNSKCKAPKAECVWSVHGQQGGQGGRRGVIGVGETVRSWRALWAVALG